MLLYLRQLLRHKPNPTLVLPSILLFPLGSDILAVIILTIQLKICIMQRFPAYYKL